MQFLRRVLCGGLGLVFILPVSSFLLSASAQEDAPSPPLKKIGVKLLFIPPPMEGTFALGIYDAHGKLVRTLHHDAATAEFGVALNGLITYWDGRDESGAPLPAGAYRARGFCVGEIGVEGEAVLCNDWITGDDSPRLRRILEIFPMPGGGFGLGAQTPENNTLLAFDADGKPGAASGGLDEKILVRNGALIRSKSGVETPISLPGLTGPVVACPARDGGIWVIDGSELKQFTAAGEFMRRLAAVPGEPVPVLIAASSTRDEIFLVEQNEREQRLRALTLVAAPAGSPPPQPTSIWKAVFQKTILFNDTLEAVKEQLKMPDGKPFAPQEKVKLTLDKNPLEQKKAGVAEVTVAFDKDGSFLKLGDGLPLKRLTDTSHLKWAALARRTEPDALVLFQSDGAAVEEFTISKLAKMMAFDCGEFDYDPAHLNP